MSRHWLLWSSVVLLSYSGTHSRNLNNFWSAKISAYFARPPQPLILRIFPNLNPNKSHGLDKISIRITKICGNSLCKPLEMIFKSCIKKGEFPSEWKKSNIAPVRKEWQAIVIELQTDPIAINLWQNFWNNNLQ